MRRATVAWAPVLLPRQANDESGQGLARVFTHVRAAPASAVAGDAPRARREPHPLELSVSQRTRSVSQRAGMYCCGSGSCHQRQSARSISTRSNRARAVARPQPQHNTSSRAAMRSSNRAGIVRSFHGFTSHAPSTRLSEPTNRPLTRSAQYHGSRPARPCGRQSSPPIPLSWPIGQHASGLNAPRASATHCGARPLHSCAR